MQVDVVYFLTGGLPISQKDVHALALDPRYSEGAGQLSAYLEHMATDMWRKICQIGSVSFWYYQEMAWIDGLDVHEGTYLVVTVDDTGRCHAPHDVTENAGSGSHDTLQPHQGILFLAVPHVCHGKVTSLGQFPYQPVQITCTRNWLPPQGSDHVAFAQAGLVGW